MLIGTAAFYVWNRGAKIKHLRYCQVGSIRTQADKLLKLCVSVCIRSIFTGQLSSEVMKFEAEGLNLVVFDPVSRVQPVVRPLSSWDRPQHVTRVLVDRPS